MTLLILLGISFALFVGIAVFRMFEVRRGHDFLISRFVRSQIDPFFRPLVRRLVGILKSLDSRVAHLVEVHIPRSVRGGLVVSSARLEGVYKATRSRLRGTRTQMPLQRGSASFFLERISEHKRAHRSDNHPQ